MYIYTLIWSSSSSKNIKIWKHFRKKLHSKFLRRSFFYQKVKNTVPWTFTIKEFNSEGKLGIIFEKKLQDVTQRESRIEKVIKKRGNKLCVKWKGFDNSFNSSVIKKDIIT